MKVKSTSWKLEREKIIARPRVWSCRTSDSSGATCNEASRQTASLIDASASDVQNSDQQIGGCPFNYGAPCGLERGEEEEVLKPKISIWIRYINVLKKYAIKISIFLTITIVYNPLED